MKIQKSAYLIFASLLMLSVFAQADQAADLANNWITFENTGFLQAPTVAQKIDRLTSAFQKKQYLADPLGEGSQGEFDRDPLYRFDGFDCTTFVETIMALAKSNSAEMFADTLNHIRYKNADVRFESRNHFTGLDWVPNNIHAGFLKDITRDVANASGTTTVQTLIEKSNWYQMLTADRIRGFSEKEIPQKLAQLHQRGVGLPNDTEIVEYIKLDTVLLQPELLQAIPSGSVINIVRPNWNLKDKIGTNMDISHQGFVIQSQGKTLFRHASQTEQKVFEDNLLEYLNKMKSIPSIDGIQILQVLE